MFSSESPNVEHAELAPSINRSDILLEEGERQYRENKGEAL